MAGQAFSVVRRIFAHNILMWIVTRQATDARIGSVKALAVGKTIGLKSNIDRPAQVVSDYAFPRAMTLTAEIR
jgi:hypothetical protein